MCLKMFYRVAVIGKKFESIADEEEKWYGTKYKLEKIEKNIIEVSLLSFKIYNSCIFYIGLALSLIHI